MRVTFTDNAAATVSNPEIVLHDCAFIQRQKPRLSIKYGYLLNCVAATVAARGPLLIVLAFIPSPARCDGGVTALLTCSPAPLGRSGGKAARMYSKALRAASSLRASCGFNLWKGHGKSGRKPD